jgi:hypothetical protein
MPRELTCERCRFLQLTAELCDVNFVFGDFARAEKNYRDIVIVAGAEFAIFIDVDFREASAARFQQRGNLLFGFFAQVAAGTRVNRHVMRSGQLQAAIFCSQECAGAFGAAQPAACDELLQMIVHCEIAGKFGKGARTCAGRIKGSQNFSFHRIHSSNICNPN